MSSHITLGQLDILKEYIDQQDTIIKNSVTNLTNNKVSGSLTNLTSPITLQVTKEDTTYYIQAVLALSSGTTKTVNIISFTE